jgi:uncharacterized DUF497 family protein
VTQEILPHGDALPFAVEWIDEQEDYGEERRVLLDMTGGQLFYVAYTERGDNIRII